VKCQAYGLPGVCMEHPAVMPPHSTSRHGPVDRSAHDVKHGILFSLRRHEHDCSSNRRLLIGAERQRIDASTIRPDFHLERSDFRIADLQPARPYADGLVARSGGHQIRIRRLA